MIEGAKEEKKCQTGKEVEERDPETCQRHSLARQNQTILDGLRSASFTQREDKS
jgi:hypothetical protein